MSPIQCREKTTPPCNPIVETRYVEGPGVDLRNAPPITYAFGAIRKPRVIPLRTFYYSAADECEITRLD
jgi:hypothetical protein